MGKLSTRSLWLGLAVLLVLTPLGLLAEGGAWGEWGGDELGQMFGVVPAGLASLEGLWRAPAADYEIPLLAGAPGYMLAGVVGMFAVVGVTWLIGRMLSGGDADNR